MENIEIYNSPLLVRLSQNENLIRENHNDLEILLCLKGSAKLNLNNKNYEFAKNEIVLINRLESYQITNSNGIIASIILRRKFLNLDDKTATIGFYCNSLEYSNKSVFLNLIRICTYLVSDYFKNNFSMIKAYSYAYSILAELVQDFPTTKIVNAGQQTKMDEIIDYIEQNYKNNLSLNELANEFGFSIPYLSNLFKKNLNLNFTDYYDQVRLKHSLNDLLNTDLPIIDIAIKNGFASNHAFLRAYKQQYNELPSETRKNRKDEGLNYSEELNNKENISLDDIIGNMNEETDKQLQENIYENILIKASEHQEALLILKNNPATSVVGINSARNLVYEDIRRAIVDAKKHLNIKYVSLLGIFSDGMYFCSRNKNGKLLFRFNLINEVLDYILSQDLIPIISLTFMPSVIAKDRNKTIFADEYNTSMPNKMEEWVLLLTTFFNHIIERYTIESVKKWLFIPWRQPESKYMGFSNDYGFYQFYKETYLTIKNINSNLQITSPEMMPITNKRYEWFKNFILWTRENLCLPDYLALEYYTDADWDIIDTYSIRGKSFKSVPYTKPNTDPNIMQKFLTTINNFIHNNQINIPVLITQYGMTISHYNILHDTIYMADFILKNVIDNIGNALSLTYYRLSDFEETLADINYFSGGTGLYYKNGIPKPNLHALAFLAKMQNEVLAKGSNYILTANKERNHLVLILHNYEHPNDSLCDSDIFNVPLFDRYSPFVNKSKKRVTFHYQTNYTKAKIHSFAVNKSHGCPYDKWLDCGKPVIDTYLNLDSAIQDLLKVASHPDYHYEEKNINMHNIDLEILLEPLEIKLFEIKLGN